jgi:ankyrin repeat protein
VDGLGIDAFRSRLDDLSGDEAWNERTRAVCRAMLAAGVPLERARDAEDDRLWHAAFSENPQAVQFLLDAGIAVRREGRTALHAICWHWDHGDERDDNIRMIVRTLLAAGINPGARDERGNTPLHESMSGDGPNPVAAELLLAAGADVNARNNDAQTPLVYLYETQFDYERAVPFLVRHGADPRIPNARGKNAIDLARQMIAGDNPDWRTEQWKDQNGPPCGWKAPATEGDPEYQMLDLLLQAARRLDSP